MKKLMLCALAFVLALIAVAVPVSASDRHRRSDRHRGGYEIQIPEIHIVGLPGNYNGGRYDYSRQGGHYDYRGRNYSHRGRHHIATQDNVNAWGLVNLGAGVLETVIQERRADKRQREIMGEMRRQRNGNEERVANQEPTPEVRPEETTVFRNCARVRVYVGDPEVGDGFYLEPGERRQASASSPVYGNFNGNFSQARIAWQGDMALITAPEES